MADDSGFEKVDPKVEIGAVTEDNFERVDKKKDFSITDEVRRIMSTINEEDIAGTLGSPVDLANAGMKLTGLPSSKEPLGGAESIRKGMRALGMSREGDEPKTMAGKAVAAVGGGALSGLIGGGVTGKAISKAGEIIGSPAVRKIGAEFAAPGANIAAGAGGGAGGDIGKEGFKGTALEKPAEIAGEVLGGAMTGFVPGTSIRAAKAVDPVISAYERLKLAPSAAEADVGGRAAQWLEGNILPQTFGGGGAMEKFRKRRFEELKDIQKDLATQYGAPKDRFEMGKTVQESVMDTWNQVRSADGKIIENLKAKYGPQDMYAQNVITAAANPVGGATSKTVREATLDPNVMVVQKAIRENAGVMTFDDLASLKQMLGQALEPGFQKNVNDAQISQLYNAVRSDMEQHIKTTSPDDYKALKASNARYSQAMDDFKKHFKKLVGTDNIPVSSERAYDIITGAVTEGGRGDLEEFKHVWDALSPTARGDLSATVLSRLGATDLANPGNLDTWSIGKFIGPNGYGGLSNEAKDILFNGQGQAKTRAALDDLVSVANNVQQKMLKLASSSRSGTGAIMLGQFGFGTMMGHLTGGNLEGFLWGYGGPLAAAHLLTNPAAVKALDATLRRVDAALDASARAVVDLNAIPKIQPQQQGATQQ